jgi:hypothetical protein
VAEGSAWGASADQEKIGGARAERIETYSTLCLNSVGCNSRLETTMTAEIVSQSAACADCRVVMGGQQFPCGAVASDIWSGESFAACSLRRQHACALGTEIASTSGAKFTLTITSTSTSLAVKRCIVASKGLPGSTGHIVSQI